MKITVICVGKIKESYFRDAISEYSKRLSKYTTLEIVEVADEKTSENSSDREIALIQDKEGKRILSHIKDGALCIALAIQGKKMDSVAFSDYIAKRMEEGKSQITFIIGGSLGLSEEVMKRCKYSVSFSDMTFPHQLMRVVLLEQIYRGFRILNHEPYHK
ncbi:MAG: 23S rRNA (pseudouridine(1915)-N(3))-methyltransferase RlmH [Lachnospiraceae bacterium]|jgi:23S rRNA (pseudouridine1915-N3)-methyltransferase|nr:23S rRNA (pseudouridine(1915)-N(3))-methyltransferase RlmH [Lachnospiraceae bacterium]SFT40451.1 23S rRNA (pseudouridine1915-N3)-methyltransferase [Lachnospiraceae bacterium XBD2001]MBQ1640704.1 23S rRNA (pseudouridine(1915)-N(3))-methyltransferase RlmH [Lachnospiraceae bacterium]MBQ1721860.1 23S rRNA (pseudouridine(1915)-N(3))-methyltransferase RlmH [Lachnospiraceae bacterium]MBQ2317301.1 23S rRNA (pseudouridine(1915)-N(3))-methyltransferase RlmH [Lachnospiraceae bacterium]